MSQVARTILEQIGGNKFAAMTGAKNFVGSSNALSFSIGRNCKNINRVVITLTPMDEYNMEFGRVVKGAFKTTTEFKGVHCGELQDRFEDATGMFTSL
jgi:hypothetical protein